MKKIHIIIVVAAVLAVIFLYSPDAKKSIFTEKVGDMSLTGYETGDAVSQQISGMSGLKDIPLAKAYSAVYKSGKGTMRMWVAEPPDHNVANDAFKAMNSMLGGSTGHEEHENSGDVGQSATHNQHSDTGMMDESFTKPVKVDILEFSIPDVYMMKTNNSINYYYFKMNYNMGRVYWIIFDSPDESYQLSIVKQAVMDI